MSRMSDTDSARLCGFFFDIALHWLLGRFEFVSTSTRKRFVYVRLRRRRAAWPSAVCSSPVRLFAGADVGAVHVKRLVQFESIY
mmetsp:Transcript_12989/g.46030  ORF Transcript_12989/g.46030 Transcript_12989/m.46030 type:complete len:84 (-) Transcript_12989:646-897(-)